MWCDSDVGTINYKIFTWNKNSVDKYKKVKPKLVFNIFLRQKYIEKIDTNRCTSRTIMNQYDKNEFMIVLLVFFLLKV